jgi:excisionase family DNA binding protein
VGVRRGIRTARPSTRRRLAPFSRRPPGVIAPGRFGEGTGHRNIQLGKAPNRGRKEPDHEEPEGVVSADKLLLRIEEAAKRLGIGRSLMYRLVLSGQVQSVPLGRLRRIPAEALEEYVERLRVEASGKSPGA